MSARGSPGRTGASGRSDRRIVHIGKRLGEKIAARREVGVQDDQVFAVGARERVPQVAALLVGPQVGPADVAKAEGLRHRTGLVGGPVIEDISLGGPCVSSDELGYRFQVLRSTSIGSPQMGR